MFQNKGSHVLKGATPKKEATFKRRKIGSKFFPLRVSLKRIDYNLKGYLIKKKKKKKQAKFKRHHNASLLKSSNFDALKIMWFTVDLVHYARKCYIKSNLEECLLFQ